MVRNELIMPSTLRYGRRNTQCSFHRECEALNKGRGIGYCDLDGSETICDGDSHFCDKPDALREYLLNDRDKEEAPDSMQELVKVSRGPRVGAANLGDTRNRRSCLRLSVALPLECWKRNDSFSHAGVSGNISERGLLIYSTFRDLCVSEELKIRVFFPNGYELDSFKVIATVTWKKAYSETDWNGYKYGLKFIQISRADREKLKLLLCEEITDYKFDSETDPGRSALA